jgi:hypothetical protein
MCSHPQSRKQRRRFPLPFRYKSLQLPQRLSSPPHSRLPRPRRLPQQGQLHHPRRQKLFRRLWLPIRLQFLPPPRRSFRRASNFASARFRAAAILSAEEDIHLLHPQTLGSWFAILGVI